MKSTELDEKARCGLLFLVPLDLKVKRRMEDLHHHHLHPREITQGRVVL